jgi:hypothetical protein
MERLLAFMPLAILANIGAGPLTSVSGVRFEEGWGPSSTRPGPVRGEVGIIFGRVDSDDISVRRDEVYVSQDVSGREVRLEVGTVTRIHGTVFPGDRIIAVLSKNGIPSSIRKVKG